LLEKERTTTREVAGRRTRRRGVAGRRRRGLQEDNKM
jgi:hypothetical protein